MATFHWRPEYALGIPEMDQQHEEIFSRLADLGAAVEAGEKRASIQEHLASVREHAAFHFRAEESLLGEVGFPGIVQQRVQHGIFLRRLQQAEVAAAGHGLSPEAVQSLESWILGHVAGLDREYLPFVTPAGRSDSRAGASE